MQDEGACLSRASSFTLIGPGTFSVLALEARFFLNLARTVSPSSSVLVAAAATGKG